MVIEHNLDVVKTADWIVDLGPEGGSGGGEIIATGTPEAIADTSGSYTGQFLVALLNKQPKPKSNGNVAAKGTNQTAAKTTESVTHKVTKKIAKKVARKTKGTAKSA